jgi:HEAT repeat protein
MAGNEEIRARLIESLVRYLSGPDDDLRLTAAEALLMSTWDPAWTPDLLIDAGGVVPVVASLSDDAPPVRSAAAQLIAILVLKGELDIVVEAGAQHALEKLKDDPDPVVRTHAAEAVQAIQTHKCT